MSLSSVLLITAISPPPLSLGLDMDTGMMAVRWAVDGHQDPCRAAVDLGSAHFV
jgi:hypothetical protein